MSAIHRPFNIAIRHAHSEVQGLLIEEKCRLYREKGDGKLELTGKGKSDALHFGQHLFPHGEMDYLMILYGDDMRCTQTALAIYQGIIDVGSVDVRMPMMLPELTKQSFGDLDGYLTSAERKKYAPTAHEAFKQAVKVNGEIDARPMNGESYRDLAKRLSDARERVLHEWYAQRFLYGEKVAVLSITNGTNVLILRSLARGEPLENIIPYIDKVKNLKGYDLTY